MISKENLIKLSEKEADKYFIYKFDELAKENEKIGSIKLAKLCRENVDRIKNKKDLIEFEEANNTASGGVKKHTGISKRYAGWFSELADKKEKDGNTEFAEIFRKRAEKVRSDSKFFWVWDKKYNEYLED